MTQLSDETLELCKRLYELTGWETDTWYDSKIAQVGGERVQHPVYTSDYLLDKLPKKIQNDEENWLDIYHDADTHRWQALYEYAKGDPWGDFYEAAADTPLKALLKLSITLAEKGLL